MATTATGYTSPPPTFSRSSSLSVARSPDTASPIYPERAIRPLPKSRLKSKLSPEQASSIVFPPDPPPISPTLNFSPPDSAHGSSVHRAVNGDAARSHYVHQRSHAYPEPEHEHCTCGEDGDSDLDEAEFLHPAYRYSAPPYPGSNMMGGDGHADGAQRRQMDGARLGNKAPGSAASSADGYESFENTSNKKKRKIPLSGTGNMHQSQLSAEMASMGISGGSVDGAVDDVHGGVGGVATQQHLNGRSSAYGAVGISGAGRGRYGRQTGRSDQAVRRPLASSNINAHGYNARLPPKHGTELGVKTSIDTGIENTHTGGIISEAIKSAAQQGPLTPHRGHDSSSLLSSGPSSASPANAKTQFTFAMESESASKMMDQHTAAYGLPPPNGRGTNGNAPGGRGVPTTTHGTQTAPSYRGGPQHHPNNGGVAGRPPPPPGAGNQQHPPAPLPKPKPRRRPSKEYALAARQRRLQQEYTNYHHPPSKDNMWICEFCEYEDIFGVPPVALIRQYEIKDRAERKRAAEKRRLLEKARAKGRKNKKGGKNNKNGNAHNSATATAPHHPANYDPSLPPDGDDYYEEDYDGDDYDPVGPDDQYPGEYYPPPPPPAGTPHALEGHPGPGGGGEMVARAAG